MAKQSAGFVDEHIEKVVIGACIAVLGGAIDRKVDHYAYPDGQAQHYNDEVIEKLKRVGIRCSPTAITGVNTLADDLFHLKRIMVV